jgi:hypothetical protein
MDVDLHDVVVHGRAHHVIDLSFGVFGFEVTLERKRVFGFRGLVNRRVDERLELVTNGRGVLERDACWKAAIETGEEFADDPQADRRGCGALCGGDAQQYQRAAEFLPDENPSAHERPLVFSVIGHKFVDRVANQRGDRGAVLARSGLEAGVLLVGQPELDAPECRLFFDTARPAAPAIATAAFHGDVNVDAAPLALPALEAGHRRDLDRCLTRQCFHVYIEAPRPFARYG